MKGNITFELDRFSVKKVFPEKRIKNKLQIIEIILEACRFINGNSESRTSNSSPKLLIKIAKMNRIFLFSGKKSYSITFPFSIEQDKNKIQIKYKDEFLIDAMIISDLITIVKDEKFLSEDCFDFIDPISNFEEYRINNYWNIMRDLMLNEDGYIRYDIDQERFLEAQAKKQEHKHPLHHLDIFYSNQATFKVGLNNELQLASFIDTLDTTTDCKYLGPAPRTRTKKKPHASAGL